MTTFCIYLRAARRLRRIDAAYTDLMREYVRYRKPHVLDAARLARADKHRVQKEHRAIFGDAITDRILWISENT